MITNFLIDGFYFYQSLFTPLYQFTIFQIIRCDHAYNALDGSKAERPSSYIKAKWRKFLSKTNKKQDNIPIQSSHYRLLEGIF